MSRALRRSHLRWWLLVGPVAIGVLAVALVLKPKRPVESFTPADTGARP